MEVIRVPFYAGLVALVLGVVLLAIGVFTQPAGAGTSPFYGLMWGAAVLLAFIGAFFAVAIGLVYAVNLLVEPRSRSKST